MVFSIVYLHSFFLVLIFIFFFHCPMRRGSEEYPPSTIELTLCHIDLRQNSLRINNIFSVILAVNWVESCGKRTSQRLQAKAVPTESVHKKLPTKSGTLSTV